MFQEDRVADADRLLRTVVRKNPTYAGNAMHSLLALMYFVFGLPYLVHLAVYVCLAATALGCMVMALRYWKFLATEFVSLGLLLPTQSSQYLHSIAEL